MIDKNFKLLHYYNNLVDWEKRLEKEIPFIEGVLKEKKAVKILDAGCGVGKHSLRLAEKGFIMTSADLNEEHIQEALKGKERLGEEKGLESAKADERLNYIIEDMTGLSSLADNEFDGLFSIGNTMASFDEQKLKKTFSTFHRVLKKGGIFIGHILNYDTFKEKDHSDIRSAVIEGIETIYIKTFHHEKDYMVMLTNFLTREGERWQGFVNSTAMYKYTPSKIESLLTETGFHNISFHNGFTPQPFDREKTRDMVFMGEKIR